MGDSPLPLRLGEVSGVAHSQYDPRLRVFPLFRVGNCLRQCHNPSNIEKDMARSSVAELPASDASGLHVRVR